MQQHLTDKNIALDLVRVTEAAALAAARFIGRGDKDSVDAAAVDAMRIAFQGIHVRGTVIIGEGEKDNAPMLFNGEKVGFGDGLEVDVAVDPLADLMLCLQQVLLQKALCLIQGIAIIARRLL